MITLAEPGPLVDELLTAGITVHSLGARSPWAAPILPSRIATLLRSHRAEIVQTWMYHADLVGGIAARMAGLPAVWGIQAGTSVGTKRSTAILRRALAPMAKYLATEIVCCGETSRTAHVELGFPSNMVVVPNACDTERFEPDRDRREQIRAELGIGDAPLVGMVARADALKDHESLITAIAIVRRTIPNTHLVLVGAGVDTTNGALVSLIRAAGIDNCTHLLGARSDVEAIDASLDVFVLASRSEGLPLVLVEAMSCGVPAIASDVGDCARVIGDTGRVVAVGATDELAAAISEVLALGATQRATLGARARSRVQAEYSLDAALAGYSEVWRRAATPGRSKGMRPARRAR